MVVFFDKKTKKIKRVEHNVLLPKLPDNKDYAEKKAYYDSKNEDYICLNYEAGNDIANHDLCFDANDNFVGLQPK